MADEPQRLPDAPGGYGPSGRSPWLDVNWREHQRWVTIDGRRVNVIDVGSGPPVVFIHGLSGSWQNWLEQMPVFARDHRVIAFDLPGFGASAMPREKITISGYGRFVAALLDELGVGSAAVVGNSMGGFIGIELAIRFPERVERLVLVSAAGLSIEYLRNERALRRPRRARQSPRCLQRLGGLALGRRSRAARSRGARSSASSPTAPIGCPARWSPSRSAARASRASSPRSTRSPITRSATAWARSPARRSSSGAPRTSSSRPATPTSSRA